MTRFMPTANGGEIEAGFFSSDVSRVQLGEAEPITTQQFVGYAAITLVEGVFPNIAQDEKVRWAADMHRLRATTDALPTLQLTGRYSAHQDPFELADEMLNNRAKPEDAADLEHALSAAISPVELPTAYQHNPFLASPDGQIVTVAGRHEVLSEEFFNFTFYVIHGGFMGWGTHGTFQEVKDAAIKLDDALAVPPPSAT